MTTKSASKEESLANRASIPEEEIVAKKELNEAETDAVERALKAADQADNRYTGFSVGAVLAQPGERSEGANIERADFDSSVCAERHVLLGVDLKTDGEIVLAISTREPDGTPNPKITTPCGLCRQTLAEKANDAGRDVKILLADGKLERIWPTTISNLLPYSLNHDTINTGIDPPKDEIKHPKSFDEGTVELISDAKERIEYASRPENDKEGFKEGAVITTENSGRKFGASFKFNSPIRTTAPGLAIQFLQSQRLDPITVKKVISVARHEKIPEEGLIFPLSGKCRQIIFEVGERGGSDPEVIMASYDKKNIYSARISQLLPQGFGENQM